MNKLQYLQYKRNKKVKKISKYYVPVALEFLWMKCVGFNFSLMHMNIQFPNTIC